MAEDVLGLLARINQPDLRYLTFADSEEGPEDSPAVVETRAGGEAKLARTSRPRRADLVPAKGGLLRRYRPAAPEPVVVSGNDATHLKALFDHYARLMNAPAEKRRA